MKKTRNRIVPFLILTAAYVLSAGPQVSAQENGELPPDKLRYERPVPPPDAPPPSDRHTERWLKRMQERDPEEYERLKNLMTEDPQAFHEELAQRLGRMRMRQCFRHNPQIFNAFQELPEQEKERIANRFFAPPPYGEGDSPEEPCPSFRRPRDDRDKNMRRLKPLVKKYKNAKDEETKEALRTELLNELGTLFDERTEERRRSILRLQKQLDHLNEKLAEREAHRDDIIHNRFDELTRDDALKW